MILILCNDDAHLVVVANQQAGNNQFGQAHQLTPNTPQLGQNENLFMTAHGVQGEIGNQAGPHAWNAADLWDDIQHLFPANYRGNIYFSVCLGANPDRRVGLSYIEAFRDICGPFLRHPRIYGHFGNTGMQILPPGHRDWEEVVRY